MKRRYLIAGNWKMHAGGHDALELASAVATTATDHPEVDTVIAPPFTAIASVSYSIHEAKLDCAVAGQNMHHEESGAFTGEVSAPMLRAAGAHWVILGHSERRQLFGETDEAVTQKTAAAFTGGLYPIVCVGETLAQREAGETLEVVRAQVAAVIDVLAESPGDGVIAYEPVWAIGTGMTATPEDAQEVHAAIRAQLREHGETLAAQTRILYGGSVKPQNAEGLLAQADVDGALVGGASLDAAAFGKIIEIAARLAQQEAREAPEEGDAEAPAKGEEAAGGEASTAEAGADEGESAADEGESAADESESAADESESAADESESAADESATDEGGVEDAEKAAAADETTTHEGGSAAEGAPAAEAAAVEAAPDEAAPDEPAPDEAAPDEAAPDEIRADDEGSEMAAEAAGDGSSPDAASPAEESADGGAEARSTKTAKAAPKAKKARRKAKRGKRS